jgi:hypothetical protein
VVLEKEEFSWTERVKNEVTHRVEEENNIPYAVKRRKGNWMGDILLKDLPSKTCYGREDRIYGKTRKKT